MFLVDAFFKHRSTEPIWFICFRGFIAVIFSIILLGYSILQFSRVGQNLYSIKLRKESINETIFAINICTEISQEFGVQIFSSEFVKYPDVNLTNSMKIIPPCQIVHFSIKSDDIIWWNASVPFNISDTFNNLSEYLGQNINNRLNLTFNSFRFQNRYNLDDLYHFFDQSSILGGEISSIYPRALLITLDEFTSGPNETLITNFLSNIGGIYSAIGGFFILLFGMPKLAPCFTKNLAKKYVSSAGIPLAEKVENRPEASSLEQRIQILETLLHDYYLDDYYLKKVKEVIILHKKDQEKLEKFRSEKLKKLREMDNELEMDDSEYLLYPLVSPGKLIDKRM
ncbi:18097_t:CDS:2 [Funneliformis geosporum]|nr:18097_t:CDS:2 [Funneliformis geosporum]